MENGTWKMTNVKCINVKETRKVRRRKWKCEPGIRKVDRGKWKVETGKWKVESGRWKRKKQM